MDQQKPLQKPKPLKLQDQEPKPCQHIRILDCDKPVSRIFYECYHCFQGLLSECDSSQPVRDVEVVCPTCGKSAIRLVTNKVISTTSIPSPWGD